MPEPNCLDGDLDIQAVARMNPFQRVQLALSSLMPEIGMPMLVARRRLPMDIDALMDMRLLRASGSEGQTRV